MHSILEPLNSKNRRQLYHDIYYLNMRELLRVCKAYQIPMKIWYEFKTKDETKIRASSLADRKKVLIRRLVYLLKHNKRIPKTVFPSRVVKFKFPSKLCSSDYVYFGQYKNGSKPILRLMKSLTEKKFKFGSVAQEILLQAWTKGVTLTYGQLASLWLKRTKNPNTPHPEWAYLYDLKKGINMDTWTEDREEYANRALKVLQVK